MGRETESMRERLTPVLQVEDQVNLAALPLYEMPSDEEVRQMARAVVAATKNMGIGQAFWYLIDLFGRAAPPQEGKEEQDPAKNNREFVDGLGDKITFQNVELSLQGAGGVSSPLTPSTDNTNLFKISIDLDRVLIETPTGEEEEVFELSLIKDFHILPDKALVSISWASSEDKEKEEDGGGGGEDSWDGFS